MIRVITFDGHDLRHAQYYALIYKAWAERGGDTLLPLDRQPKPVKETVRAERRIGKALRAIGKPFSELPAFVPGEPPTLDTRIYSLLPEGGIVRLAQSDFSLLFNGEDTGYVQRLVLPASVSDTKADCEEWLESSDKTED